jgi:hypothetical protein
VLLFEEYQARTSAAALAEQKYQVSQAEFQAMASSVLTRLRLNAAQDSSQAQSVESQVDSSLSEREKES